MNKSPAPSPVFLSYARADSSIVERLRTDLHTQGIITWIDRESIQPGTTDWEESLRTAIRNASAVLLVASPHARSSPYVKDELRIAQMYQRPIYPVWVIGSQWMEAIPFGLGSIQYIDAREERYALALSDIVSALKRVPFIPPSSTQATAPGKSESGNEPHNSYIGLQPFTSADEISLDTQPTSVFQFNEPLTDPNEFYGRIRERETLLNRSRKGASTSIVGPRRIGKTWLMSYMRLMAPTLLGPRFRVGYLDATLASCATVTGFTARALEELGLIHLAPDPTHLGLEMLERGIQSLKSNNQRALLCIDEFEGFSKRHEFTLDFFTSLRAITQAGLCLVVASKRPLIDIVGDDGKTSGFFNVFEQLTLESFSAEEAQVFAHTKGIQAGFTQHERDYLLKYGTTERQQWSPIRLQLVGKMLLEDKTLAQREGTQYYSPDDPSYWQKFEQRLVEKYRGVVR